MYVVQTRDKTAGWFKNKVAVAENSSWQAADLSVKLIVGDLAGSLAPWPA